MPVHGYGNQVHQRRAYDYPQETARDMARALRMTEILENWEARERERVMELWDADNRDNRVTKIPDVGIKEDGTPQGVSFAGESSR